MGSIKLTLVGLCFSMGVVLKVKSKIPYRHLLEDSLMVYFFLPLQYTEVMTGMFVL
jgi:hypothetical protein